MKAKGIEKPMERFKIVHMEKAKEAVFSLGKAIRMSECIGSAKGDITVVPSDGGRATIKCRAWPIMSKIAECREIECDSESDFERAYDSARIATLSKMAQIAKNAKKAKAEA